MKIILMVVSAIVIAILAIFILKRPSQKKQDESKKNGGSEKSPDPSGSIMYDKEMEYSLMLITAIDELENFVKEVVKTHFTPAAINKIKLTDQQILDEMGDEHNVENKLAENAKNFMAAVAQLELLQAGIRSSAAVLDGNRMMTKKEESNIDQMKKKLAEKMEKLMEYPEKLPKTGLEHVRPQLKNYLGYKFLMNISTAMTDSFSTLKKPLLNSFKELKQKAQVKI